MIWTISFGPFGPFGPFGTIDVAVVVVAVVALSISRRYCAGMAEYNRGGAFSDPGIFWMVAAAVAASRGADAERDDVIPDNICNVFSETGI
jgi:hypothetical protein